MYPDIIIITKYLDASKALQYFDRMKHNSTVFAKVIKVPTHRGQWGAELSWYSPTATHKICLYRLEHGLGLYGFMFP